jgi:hypothetical protein
MIFKATKAQQESYAQQQPKPLYPLWGYAVVEVTKGLKKNCPVEFLNEGKDNPNYEIMAPDGYKFTEGVHSLLCVNLADVRDRLKYNGLEACADDCDCKEEKQ